MEISEIREKRNELEVAIEQLIETFVSETQVDISSILLQPAVWAYDSEGNRKQEITPIKVEVELVI